MFTTAGRDPARTNRVMGELWSHATKANLSPVRWRLGFYNLRDVLHARDPHFQERAFGTVRMETVWGCEIVVVSLSDTIELITYDRSAPRASAFTTLVPGER